MITYPHQGTSSCPRCPDQSVQCPCIDYDGVDVGIGEITGNHIYFCTVHGEFGFSYYSGEVIFRDDQQAVAFDATGGEIWELEVQGTISSRKEDDHEDDF